jgi:hypothetical protein
MPPKKKNVVDEDAEFMKAARFGRVKNTLSMGFGELFVVFVVFVCCSWW